MVREREAKILRGELSLEDFTRKMPLSFWKSFITPV
jgi:hypothetical protein